jgi:hypothetical protein
MANLQIKDLPEEMHEALRARAREERITLSELATGMLERELSVMSMRSWLRKRANSTLPSVNIDSVALIDAARDDYDRR